MEPLLNVETVAKILALSPWTVRSKIREGKLRPLRLGRRVVLEQAELERFLDEARKACGIPPNEGEQL